MLTQQTSPVASGRPGVIINDLYRRITVSDGEPWRRTRAEPPFWSADRPQRHRLGWAPNEP
jgi:hypothetical protein